MDSSSEGDFEIISKEDISGFASDPTSDSDINSIREWLKPTEYLSPGNEYMKHLHSYIPGTGDWIRTSKSSSLWHGADDQGCLWIKGVPGSGKSVFSASVVKSFLEEGHPVLFFFFRQIVATNHSPKYLVRDWLSQLLPYSRTLQLRLKDISEGVDGMELTELWDVLCHALESMPKVYCIADALDEMDDSHDEVISRLKELGKRKPANIKVMLTSRPIPKVEAILRGQEILSVKLDLTLIYPDIIRYVETRCKTLDQILGATKREEIKAAICHRAKGLFLHARLMTDNLMEGLRRGTIIEATLPTSLERLPQNLKELYTSMLAEHSQRSGVTQEQQLNILQCVTHSSRPLRLIELGSLIMWMRGEKSLKEGKALVRASCGRLLEILEDESVSVIHHSFTEFLKDSNRERDIIGFPVLNSAVSHRMLAVICLQYLDSCSLPTRNTLVGMEYEKIPADEDLVPAEGTGTDEESDVVDDDEDEFMDYEEDEKLKKQDDENRHRDGQELKLKYPLLDYAITNFAHHVLAADLLDQSIFEALDLYLIPCRPAFEIWILVNWHSHRRGNINSLQLAVLMGLNSYVKHLIVAGAMVDACCGEGRTALSYAAEKGHVGISKILLEHGAVPDASDRVGLKPLHYAVMQNHVEVVRLLLAQGVHPLTKKTKRTPEWPWEFGTDKGETPVQYACESGHTDIVIEFLEYLEQEDLCRCLSWTTSSRKSTAVEAVLNTGRVPVDVLLEGVSALYIAANRIDKNMVEVLLKHGADPNLRCDIGRFKSVLDVRHDSVVKFVADSELGPTPMHAFVGYSNASTRLWGDRKLGEDCLKLLLDAGGDVNIRDKEGKTPLHYASAERSSICISEWCNVKTGDILTEILLIHGADPNATSVTGATALHMADPSNPKLVDILVRHGANINARDRCGTTPLHSMFHHAGWKKSKVESFTNLLKHGADCNAVDKKGRTVLHQVFKSIGTGGEAVLYKALIEAGIDLNKKDKFDIPPLHFLQVSVRPNFEESILSTLIEAGLDLNATDPEGCTILFKLLKNSKTTMQPLRTIMKLGCSISARDSQGATILHYCVRDCGSLEALQLLIDSGADPTWVDYAGNTIIHEAARSRSIRSNGNYSERFKALVDYGVPTDTKNHIGHTPLHLASAICHSGTGRRFDFLDLFLNGKFAPKSDVDAIDSIGARPIHYAASLSEFHVGRLLEAGADPAVFTYEGLSPLHIAARARQSNVIGLLLSEYRKRGNLANLIDQKCSCHNTALHYACRSGQPESVRYLLANGAYHSSRLGYSRCTPLHTTAEFPVENLYWQFDRRRDTIPGLDAVGITLGDRLRPRNYSHFHLDGPSTERTLEIIDMLLNAGADLEARATNNDSTEITAMDLAISTSCTEMVNELRRRGLKASDPFEESVISPDRGIREAKLLLETVYPDSTRGRGRGCGGSNSTTGEPSTKSHAAKFQRLLELGDYDFFKEFVRCGGDLKAPGAHKNETGLHKLVSSGHTLLLECFIDEVSQLNNNKWIDREVESDTLLYHACKRELPNTKIMRVLVEKAMVDINQVSGKNEATALHEVAAGSHFWHIEAIEYLLENGADVEARDADGMTPLMGAVSSDGFWRAETIRVLLDHGANPNVIDAEGRSCLNMSDHPNITRTLVQHGADITIGKPPVLTSAIELIDIGTITVLLEAGANPNTLPQTAEPDHEKWRRDYHDPFYPVHRAAKLTSEEELQVDRYSVRKMMMTLLLNHGANPYAEYEDGSNVLQRVIEEHEVLEPFWQFPNLNLEHKGQGGRTPFISTCYPKSRLEDRYNNHNSKPKAVVLADDALLLLGKGVDATVIDDMGRSSLHWLCTIPEEFNASEKKLFITLTERVPGLIHQKDKDGYKPLQIALKNSHFWAADTLVNLGADPEESDLDGNTALHFLASQLCGQKKKAAGAADQFSYYLSLGLPIDQRNRAGNTPLLNFISTSWVGTAEVGRNNGNHAMEKDITHSKALHIFRDAGADIFVRDNEGGTLLHVTAKRWYETKYVISDQAADMVGIFRDLMALGLDPRAEDGMMRTAIDVAVASGNHFIVDLFREKHAMGKEDNCDEDSEEE